MKRGGGIVSTAAAPLALYGLSKMVQSKNRKTMRRRKNIRGGGNNNNNNSFNNVTSMKQAIEAANRRHPGMVWDPSQKKYVKKNQSGGSVLANALPSLVLYGLAKSAHGTKKNNNKNSNKNSNKSRKTRKMRKMSRRGRRM